MAETETKEQMPAEVLEPLTDVEAGLVAAVDRWRDQRKAQLEAEWQNVMNEANQRIAPVLRAHGVVKNAAWELRPDEAAKSGWVLAKLPADASAPADGSEPEKKPSRAELRRAKKEVVKLVPRSRRGGR